MSRHWQLLFKFALKHGSCQAESTDQLWYQSKGWKVNSRSSLYYRQFILPNKHSTGLSFHHDLTRNTHCQVPWLKSNQTIDITQWCWNWWCHHNSVELSPPSLRQHCTILPSQARKSGKTDLELDGGGGRGGHEEDDGGGDVHVGGDRQRLTAKLAE